MRSGFLISVAALAMSVSSCMVGPNYTTPKAPVADQWTPKSASTSQPSVAAEAFWWKRFDDRVLGQLIDTACRGNLSLQAAGVRVLQARAQLNKTIGELFPQQQGLSSQVDYNYLNASANVTQSMTRNPVSGQALFAATWEIDFWGKFRRGIESSQAAYLGSMAAYDDALVTLIADVGGTYVNIRTLEEQRLWVEEQRSVAKKKAQATPVKPVHGHAEMNKRKGTVTFIGPVTLTAGELMEYAHELMK